VFITIDDPWETIKMKINREKHSAYPVCKTNNLDDIIGIVLLKDLFTPSTDKEFDIKDFIKEPIYFNESTNAYKVLESFKKEKMHYGIVVDEYGTTQGIVTMDDVVDALFGDVTENDQDEYQLIQRDENSWLVDGQYSIINFLKYFDIELKENYQSEFTTVAGLIIYSNNTLPEIGQKIKLDNYELEIIDAIGNIVLKRTVNTETEQDIMVKNLQVSSGIYFVKLSSGSKKIVRRLLID